MKMDGRRNCGIGSSTFCDPTKPRDPVTPCECAKEQVASGPWKEIRRGFCETLQLSFRVFCADVKFFEEFEQCLFDLYADVFPELKSEQLEEEPTSDDSDG